MNESKQKWEAKSSYEITITKDGMYDNNGMSVTIDDLIQAHLANGGKIERKTEPQKIYKQIDGKYIVSVEDCDVVIFY